MNKVEMILFVILIIFGLINLIILMSGIEKSINRPLFFRYTFKRKDKKMALVYGLSCAAPVDADVVERRLSVSVNGEVKLTNSYESTTVDFGEFTFAQDDNVVVTLMDVDDVGNVSDPAVLEFVATDTLPPAVPGGFTVSLLREVADDPVDVVPDPVDMDDPE